ncbi:hypothetical protein KIKIMORA_01860 [Brevundimonas phage vB_BpoS-Kikimora]|uniref:GmrSD restriction endonucleases N-terminal domain-containing protein n=1 Tax=Brevundimonas phage vB_BpoS-Kikimora TaxID=2948601 RepID=A0A9E7MSN2_9CAUD|nr:hypothetical protein KIKIMORA_01860 [Brevundimonas phage vB_BpoS-Kikimora]
MTDQDKTTKMPTPWFRASNTAGTMTSIFRLDAMWDRPLREGERKLGNFILPAFQRPPVWSEAQKVRFIESIWQRLPLGAYIVNRVPGIDSPYDNLLLDGQQRITAIMDYVADAFPVLGYRWSELTPIDRRQFSMIPMSYMETALEDMDLIQEVYDRLAYGGTAHEPKDTTKEVFWRVYHPTTGPMEYDTLDAAQAVYDRKHPVLGGPDKRLHLKLTEVTELERTLKAGDVS